MSKCLVTAWLLRAFPIVHYYGDMLWLTGLHWHKVYMREEWEDRDYTTWEWGASVVTQTWRWLKPEKLLPFPIQLTNSSLSASWTGVFCFHYSNTKKDDNTSIQRKGIFVFREALAGVFTKKDHQKFWEIGGCYSETAMWPLLFPRYHYSPAGHVFVRSTPPSFPPAPPCLAVTDIGMEVMPTHTKSLWEEMSTEQRLGLTQKKKFVFFFWTS